MHIVGVLGRDPQLASALTRFRDPLGRFHLHPLHEGPVPAVLAGLLPLEFAGVLFFGEDLEREACAPVQRRSLDAQEVGAVDTVSVAAGGLIGEYNAGRAAGHMLAAGNWDARGARAVILGAGCRAAAIARDLSSMGVSQIAILAESRPTAEQTVTPLAASTEVIATAISDHRSEALLLEADVLVALDERAAVPAAVMGPHLCVVDLTDRGSTQLRRHALDAGALAFDRLDYQAHRLALGLGHVLGTNVDPAPLLDLLHDAAGS